MLQEKGRRGPDAVRRSLRSSYYETDGIYRQIGRSTDTGCHSAPTSINSAVIQTARRLKTCTERNKTNKGQHSRENKRKVAREEDAWTIATLPRWKAGGC